MQTADVHHIKNGSNNTIGGSCYSAHQAVARFPEHYNDMVSCVHRKCLTRADVSGDVYETLECVTKTDSKFSNRVSGKNDAKEHIQKLGNNMA